MSEKCKTPDCPNRTNQGRFVGEYCAPCHQFAAWAKNLSANAKATGQ